MTESLQQAEQAVTIRLAQDRVACSFDKAELRQLLRKLQERLDSAAEIEVSHFNRGTLSDEDYAHAVEVLRAGFQIRPTVVGADGQELYGHVDEVFDSPNFPEVVQSLYVNNEIFLKATENYVVRNRVEMFLDFSRPAIFDFNLMPGQRTPNETNYKVRGLDATWVNGLFHEVQSYLSNHRSAIPWLHEHSIYDVFLWFAGYPVGFLALFQGLSIDA